MSSPTSAISRPGISKTVFAVSLILVAVAAGLGGYFTYSLVNPGVPSIDLNGAGSSLVYPILSTWGSNYNKLHSNVHINYQSIGSGAGITDFNQTVVDFAGTDAAPSASDLAHMAAAHSRVSVITIPETIGAVTIAYNIPGVSTGLLLNETLAAKIFNGTISRWDDQALVTLNPQLSSVHQGIIPVHRGDSSGTTFIFSGYLIKSAIWKASQSKSWPPGCPQPAPPCVVNPGQTGQQNTGVATAIQTTPYSVGYVEVAYALQTNMNVAYVQNYDRTHYIQPTLANITAAVSKANVNSLPLGNQSWSSVSLILEPGDNSYPILGFTYLLVYQELNVRPLMNSDKAKALVDFIWYVVHDGQSAAGSLDYPALPQSIVSIDETSIKSITYNGQSLPT